MSTRSLSPADRERTDRFVAAVTDLTPREATLLGRFLTCLAEEQTRPVRSIAAKLMSATPADFRQLLDEFESH